MKTADRLRVGEVKSRPKLVTQAGDAASCCNRKSKIIDSRPGPDGTWRRRRWCVVCDRRWTTYEYSEAAIAAIQRREEIVQGVISKTREFIGMLADADAEVRERLGEDTADAE